VSADPVVMVLPASCTCHHVVGDGLFDVAIAAGSTVAVDARDLVEAELELRADSDEGAVLTIRLAGHALR
jgi:hypothetical protein